VAVLMVSSCTIGPARQARREIHMSEKYLVVQSEAVFEHVRSRDVLTHVLPSLARVPLA